MAIATGDIFYTQKKEQKRCPREKLNKRAEKYLNLIGVGIRSRFPPSLITIMVRILCL